MCNNLKNATKTLSTKFVPYLRKVIMMTNEQVIINNIDVSECEHLTETRHCRAQMAVMGTDANRCKCFPNCYYKQLARKKEECEELKSEIKHYKQIAQYHGNLSVKYTNKSAKYKQALTKIKEIAEKKCLGCTNFCDCDNISFCVIKQILQKISEVEND